MAREELDSGIVAEGAGALCFAHVDSRARQYFAILQSRERLKGALQLSYAALYTGGEAL